MSALADTYTRRFIVEVATDQEANLPTAKDIQADLSEGAWDRAYFKFTVVDL